MFALKLSLAVLILFFLMYNGASIMVQEKPLMRRMVELSLYIIILMIIGNFGFNVITYYQVKGKIGEIGDPGIRGQKGDSGDKGKCESNCGIKVCVLDLLDTANKTFYTELERIYGGVMLQYDIPKNKKIVTKKIISFIWNKIYDNHRILVIIPENREKFMAETEEKKKKIIESILSVYVTRNSDNSRLYVRIHAGKSLGEKLRKEITKNSRYFEFNKIVPSIVSKEDEMDSLNKCMMASVGEKIVYKESNENSEEGGNDEIIIKGCDQSELDELKNSGATPELADPDQDRIVEDSDIKEKKLNKLKIRNLFFINKIRSICNSPEYQETLEIELKNKPNEKKLIDFLSETMTKWVRTLMTFTYIKEDGEMSYGGMRFLLTREADVNVFHKYLDSENYRDSYSKVELTKMNPLYELKKYDIWNWNQPYTNVPLIFEKCEKEQDVPLGREPILSIIETNNYEKVYDSNTIKSKWYSSDRFSYCAYNQMGEFNDNPEDKKECIFYDTNSQGHDYLEGRQPAWKSIEYTRPKSLGLYHPKSIPKHKMKETNPVVRNTIKNEYFKDDYNRYYFPLGSVWSGNTLEESRQDANHFNPISRETNTGNLGDGPEKKTILVTGDVKDPVDYKKIWNSKGDGKGCLECQEEDTTLWRPIPPTGYICLGDVAVKGTEKPDVKNEALIKCVPEKCVAKIPINTKVWDSDLLLKKTYGEGGGKGNYFRGGSGAIHSVHYFFLLLGEQINKINFDDVNTFNFTKNDLITIIDRMINNYKNVLSKNEKEETDTFINPYSSKRQVERLEKFKNSDFIGKWPITSSWAGRNLFYNEKKEIYEIVKYFKKIHNEILELYYLKYEKYKDLGFRESKATRFNEKIVIKAPFAKGGASYTLMASEMPILSGSKPVNIYSAGNKDSKIEKYYRPDLKLDENEGHNLFVADNEKSIKKPEFAYKLKKQCFQPMKGTPPESNSVAGTLSNLERKGQERKSAMHYFTYPINIIISCEAGGERSYNGKPKKYYISFAKEIENKDTGIKTPTYIIRAFDDKKRKFTKCIGIFDDELIDSDIDINYKGNLWVPINIDSSKTNFTPNEKEKVVINLVSYKDNSKYFSHSFDLFGKGTARLSEDKQSANSRWDSKLLRD